MSHPTQSLLCTDCQSLFRTARALKIHQQRHQSPVDLSQPNYNFISSYLVVAFSSPKFPVMCERAALQGHLPLGQFSSQFYRCSTCQISFPCSRSLNYHSLNQHERDERDIAEQILEEILDEIDRFSPLIDEEIQLNFLQQASQFGLKRKRSTRELRRLKREDDRRIYPRCFHPGRTCANLCLNYLISYEDLIRNYSFQIVTPPKGNPFSQGSIVSIVAESPATKEASTNEIAKRRTIKRAPLPRSASSSSLPTKRRRQRRKIDDDVEQENDDDDDDDDESPTAKSSKPKQRQASSGSIEYVQVLNNDGPTTAPSLNNIENVKSKSAKNNDDEIILCRSTSPKKSSVQTLDPDEHIRVRCKVCGDIIEGRSRFSKHVLTMHSHLLGKTIPEATQQTTTVR